MRLGIFRRMAEIWRAERARAQRQFAETEPAPNGPWHETARRINAALSARQLHEDGVQRDEQQ